MILLSVVFCLFTLLGSALSSSPAAAKKPKPVDLDYACMSVDSEGGNKTNAPIVLLHGLFVSKEVWMGLYQLLALKTGRRVCIADLRNHGDSPQSSETTVAAMTEDIGRLLDMLDAQKAILLGHSLGGKIAIHFALNYPSRVDKLIVEDMRPNGIPPKALLEISVFLGLLQLSIKAIPKGVSEKEAKEAVLQYITKQAAKVNAQNVLANINADFLPLKCTDGSCRWKSSLTLIVGILTHPLTFLSRSTGLYNGPSLFLYGTDSSFRVKDDRRNILRLFPKAELVGIKGGYHKIHDHPDFLAAVIKFVNESD